MAGSFSVPAAGLLLDMDDVLYDATVWRRWLLQLLSRIGVHANYTCLFRVWDREYMDDVYRGRRRFCEAFDSFLRAVGLSRPQVDEVKAACQSRRRQLEETARPLPGVKTTLARLHQSGLAMGVLANSDLSSAMLRRQLDRFGFEEMFPVVVSSIDLGRTKPELATYLTALREMKLAPAQVPFVGHDTVELAGARDAGMPTIAFNFDRDAEADIYLNRFDELVDIFGTETQRTAAG